MPFYIDEDASRGLLKFRPWDNIPWLIHAFTTRAAGNFSSETLADHLPPSLNASAMSLASVRQIHSDRLCSLKSDAAPTPHLDRPEADGLLTSGTGHLLGIRTADCLPLLYVDRGRRAVAAVHAGWRGTAKGIAARAVERIGKEFGSPPGDLEVVIGPGIGPCCYEVGSEVAGQFDASAVRTRRKPHLDLPRANRSQLIQAGVKESRIWSADLCTACEAGRFYSYRRQGSQAGRMLAVIGIRVDN